MTDTSIDITADDTGAFIDDPVMDTDTDAPDPVADVYTVLEILQFSESNFRNGKTYYWLVVGCRKNPQTGEITQAPVRVVRSDLIDALNASLVEHGEKALEFAPFFQITKINGGGSFSEKWSLTGCFTGSNTGLVYEGMVTAEGRNLQEVLQGLALHSCRSQYQIDQTISRPPPSVPWYRRLFD